MKKKIFRFLHKLVYVEFLLFYFSFTTFIFLLFSVSSAPLEYNIKKVGPEKNQLIYKIIKFIF